MFDSIYPAESEPIRVVSSRWLWTARCFALIYTIFLVGGYVADTHFEPVFSLFLFLFTFGLRGLLSLVLLHFLFRSGKKSLAFGLGLGAATAFMALFGVASNALLEMMHRPNPGLDTEGLLLFWSFGICSAVLGLSSVITFRKMAREAKGMAGLRFAFRAGICCPLVAWLIFMLLVFIWLVAGGGMHI